MSSEIEDRINMEIIVDCYEPEEIAIGWYYYLESKLSFPFIAVSTVKRTELTIIGLANEEDCLSNMYVVVDLNGDDEFLFPLENIEPINTTADESQAIADWKYWVFNLGGL
ncbi:calcium-binding protein [Vibrio vulnificus]|nr:calcium-binding protein [Vibrio vulnificus]EIH1439461.1 calcium-binding protein [Vibrio vulnificus]